MAVVGACSALVATGVGGAAGQWIALVTGCLLCIWFLRHYATHGTTPAESSSVDVSRTLDGKPARKLFSGGAFEEEESFDRFNPLTQRWEKRSTQQHPAAAAGGASAPAGLAVGGGGSVGIANEAEAFYPPPTRRKEPATGGSLAGVVAESTASNLDGPAASDVSGNDGDDSDDEFVDATTQPQWGGQQQQHGADGAAAGGGEATAHPPQPPPSYPQFSFQSKDPVVAMHGNSHQPMPFKNDLFEGRVLLMLVDKAGGDEDEHGDKPYASHFNGKQRIMEIQLQGKFLRQPRGHLWLGGEIGDKMSLGWGLKAFCGVLLGVIRKIGKGNIHHSFGDAEEKPSIVSTFYHFVDRLIVTPAGEAPPALGGDGELPEDNAARKARKKAKVVPAIDTSATYTFSVYTKYVDLLHWKVCGLPGLRPFDLHSFWGTQPLTFVCYDLPEGDDQNSQHPTADKGYFFQFEWAHDASEDELLLRAK